MILRASVGGFCRGHVGLSEHPTKCGGVEGQGADVDTEESVPGQYFDVLVVEGAAAAGSIGRVDNLSMSFIAVVAAGEEPDSYVNARLWFVVDDVYVVGFCEWISVQMRDIRGPIVSSRDDTRGPVTSANTSIHPSLAP